MNRLVLAIALAVATTAAAAEKKDPAKKPASVIIGPDGSVKVVEDGNVVDVGADGGITVDAADGTKVRMEGTGADGSSVTGDSITHNSGKGKHDCKGGSISILGNKNNYTFSNCAKVSVLGNYNVVTLASGAQAVELLGNYNTANVDTLASGNLMGNYNKLNWTAGAGGKDPQLSNPGRSNKITKK